MSDEGFRAGLERLINRESRENGSDTPDFILADYLATCLDAFDKAATMRDDWYGVELRPGMRSAALATPSPKTGVAPTPPCYCASPNGTLHDIACPSHLDAAQSAEPGKPATCEHGPVHAEQTPLGLYCRECGEVVGP